jgi:hypothetical protein
MTQMVAADSLCNLLTTTLLAVCRRHEDCISGCASVGKEEGHHLVKLLQTSMGLPAVLKAVKVSDGCSVNRHARTCWEVRGMPALSMARGQTMQVPAFLILRRLAKCALRDFRTFLCPAWFQGNAVPYISLRYISKSIHNSSCIPYVARHLYLIGDTATAGASA